MNFRIPGILFHRIILAITVAAIDLHVQFGDPESLIRAVAFADGCEELNQGLVLSFLGVVMGQILV